MAEVFTIQGAGLGASCPAGWSATSQGYCKAPSGVSAAAKALQTALAALGRTVRDGVLMAVAADGVIGPATAKAVNRAFTTHIGSGQAPANFRTGSLSIFQVAQYATDLAKLVNAEVARRGGAPAAAGPSVTLPSTADPNSSAAYTPAPGALPEKSNTALLALGGLAVLAVGVGIYFLAREPGAAAPAA